MEEKNINITYEELFLKVCKILTRTLKEKNMYHIFRCFVGNSKRCHSATKALYNSLHDLESIRIVAARFREENIFYRCEGFEEMYRQFMSTIALDKLTTTMSLNEDEKVSVNIPPSEIQMYMMKMVNVLIHCCVERGLWEPNMAATLGGEVFEKVGKEIFGEDFVDETEKELKPLHLDNLYDLDGNLIKYIQDRLSSPTRWTATARTENFFDILTRDTTNF